MTKEDNKMKNNEQRKHKHDQEDKEKRSKGPEAQIDLRKVTNKKARGILFHTKARLKRQTSMEKLKSILKVEDEGYIETDNDKPTWTISRKEIMNAVSIGAASKSFDLAMESGPYKVKYTRNGKYALIGGRMGHMAGFDWQTGKLLFETQEGKLLNDITWLHNESYFAAAIDGTSGVYNSDGREVHSLIKRGDITNLTYLPYHHLLVMGCKRGRLTYQDMSTGDTIKELHSIKKPISSLTHSESNAIVYSGHSNGSINLWTPNNEKPVVQMLCHRGPVQGIAINSNGYYMATIGYDGKLALWDNRTYKPLSNYRMVNPPNSVAISQMGIVATTSGPTTLIWKDAFSNEYVSPYLKVTLATTSGADLSFCPYEDVLGIGHSKGVSSVLVPGSGDPVPIGYLDNPYETKKQKQEGLIKSLLDKIPPEMISLSSNAVAHYVSPVTK